MLKLLVLLFIVSIIVLKIFFEKVTVYEYEKGLRYNKGSFHGTLEPGQYWIFTFFSAITKVDVRTQMVSIPGQEILSSDGITIKISLASMYEIADPVVATNKIRDVNGCFYMVLQLALREIIGAMKVEEILEKRALIGEKLVEVSSKKVEELGLKLRSVNIKDIMFPGDLKKIFSQTVKAKNEGLAALEKARGETAALRNLANVANLLETHPTLLQIRLLQTMNESSQNTLVVGMPQFPIGLKTHPKENPNTQDNSQVDS